MDKVCLNCKDKLVRRRNEADSRWEKRGFCSKSCATSFRRPFDSPISEEARMKMRLAKLGKRSLKYNCVYKECEECGDKFEVQNYRKDVAKLCSMKCLWASNDRGKTSENEKTRKSNEFKKWRELVFERDDWTCQKCIKRGNLLHPHHIIGFSDNEELRFEVDNGITFCKKCHYIFHSKYGFTNNNPEQIKDMVAINEEA